MFYRQAAVGDYGQLAELRWIHEQEDGAKPKEQLPQSGFISRYVSFLEREEGNSYFCFVAEDGGKIVSNVYLGITRKLPKPFHEPSLIGYVTNVYTVPSHRNRGVGTELMKLVIQYARDHGFELLYVWPSRRSVPYYERLGFAGENEIMELLF